MSDRDEFAMLAGHIVAVATGFLTEMFGDRCKDFEPDCECCRRWKMLDALVKNPFDEGEVNGDV